MELRDKLYQIPEALTRRVLAAGVTTCGSGERGWQIDCECPALAQPKPVAEATGAKSHAGYEEILLLERNVRDSALL